MGRVIRIGTRESRLAVAQAQLLAAFCKKNGVECEIVGVQTTGDRVVDRRLDQIGGKGLFVRELDQALRARETDLSVHSAKDLPAELPDDLPILGWSRREDPRDALVLPAGCREWDPSRPVGTSSSRRMLQFRALYPDVRFEMVRGNVHTRLRKLDSGEYGALLLAASGLKRLGLEKRVSRPFSPEEMIPAACQGILAVQGRAGEDFSFLAPFFDETAEIEARAERTFIRELDGGCTTPTAAYAKREGDMLTLRGLYYSEAVGVHHTGVLTGPASRSEALGVALAMRLKMELEGGLSCER